MLPLFMRSIFIVIAMWLLSAGTFVYVLDLVYVRPRTPVTADASFCAALLFAMPNVRRVQPNVPEIGAAVDVLG